MVTEITLTLQVLFQDWDLLFLSWGLCCLTTLVIRDNWGMMIYRKLVYIQAVTGLHTARTIKQTVTAPNRLPLTVYSRYLCLSDHPDWTLHCNSSSNIPTSHLVQIINDPPTVRNFLFIGHYVLKSVFLAEIKFNTL